MRHSAPRLSSMVHPWRTGSPWLPLRQAFRRPDLQTWPACDSCEPKTVSIKYLCSENAGRRMSKACHGVPAATCIPTKRESTHAGTARPSRDCVSPLVSASMASATPPSTVSLQPDNPVVSRSSNIVFGVHSPRSSGTVGINNHDGGYQRWIFLG